MGSAKKDLVEEIKEGREISISFDVPCNIPAFKNVSWDKHVVEPLREFGLEDLRCYNPNRAYLNGNEKTVVDTYKATSSNYPGIEFEIEVTFARPNPADKPKFGFLKKVVVKFSKEVPIYG